MRFVALGDVFVDVVSAKAPAPGERVHSDIVLAPGGSAVNAALCAARLGASAAVVGRVGGDQAGELVRGALAAGGVTEQLARDPDLRTGIAVAFRDEGETGVVADRGANARLSPADVPDPLDADVLLVSGFALFQPGSHEAAGIALDRFEGGLAALDLASPKLAQAAADGSTFGADVVFATAEEARVVTGAEPEEAARLLAQNYTVACVKLGSDGALAARAGAVERAAAARVERGWPFGAGDAFAAAFLVSLASGGALAEALERACEAGAEAASVGPHRL